MAQSSPVSVLFDATAIPADRGGVGRYVDAIVAELAARSEIDLAVVCQSRDVDGFRAAGARTVIGLPPRFSRVPLRLAWEQLRLPRLARRLGADVIYSPHYTFPVLTALPRVVSIWDLTFFTLPEAHSTLKRLFFRSWIRASRFTRNLVMTSSQASADELTRIVGTPAARIRVAPLAYDRERFAVPAPSEVEAFRASLTPPVAAWIAFLGTLEPRKNVPALIEAYRSAVAGRSERPALLLAGGRGWDDDVQPAVDRAVADGFDVRALGYLPIEQLKDFLGGAEIVAYPSLGEGFGLPVLEAMATGACVLTTRELSLPEVGGDAVAYAGTDAASIATALGELLDDAEARRVLGRAAVARAAQFTWSHNADLLVAALVAAAEAAR
ncbi:glycosyltransferase family 1 protein [Gryllotalpicola kribbensis]|uniref:Glycosyltransferase family 1 protein n=1 Tax=Gryllotalpicola kribbensis TaxID=993084 RepID=A0ABP8AQC6_9MICO